MFVTAKEFTHSKVGKIHCINGFEEWQWQWHERAKNEFGNNTHSIDYKTVVSSHESQCSSTTGRMNNESVRVFDQV